MEHPTRRPSPPAAFDGVFPPSAQIRRITRENVLLLGGPAAAILQIAHPQVAAGVAAHSDFRNDALGRLHRTLDAVYTVAFSSRSEADVMRKHITAIHSKVRGNQPVAYSAFSPDAQLWVLATLISVGLDVFEQLVSPLTPSERADHYRDMRVFGEYFGLDPSFGPQNRADFDVFYSRMLSDPSLGSLPISRDIARAIVTPSRPLPLRLGGQLMRFVTVELLPSPVRERLGFQSTSYTRGAMRLLRAGIRASLPVLPAPLRFTARYRK